MCKEQRDVSPPRTLLTFERFDDSCLGNKAPGRSLSEKWLTYPRSASGLRMRDVHASRNTQSALYTLASL